MSPGPPVSGMGGGAPMPEALLAAFPRRPLALRLPPLPPGATAGYLLVAALGLATLAVAAAWAAGAPFVRAIPLVGYDAGLATVIFGVALPVCGAVAIVELGRVVRRRRRAACLSGQVLTPAALEAVSVLDARLGTLWRLREAPGRAAVDWSFRRGARPFLLAHAPLVLAVTAPGADVVVPLDRDLAWLDLTGAERRAIQDAAGAGADGQA